MAAAIVVSPRPARDERRDAELTLEESYERTVAMRRSLQELAQALQSSTPHGYNDRTLDPVPLRRPAQPAQPPHDIAPMSVDQLNALEAGLEDLRSREAAASAREVAPRHHRAGLRREFDLSWLNLCNGVLALLFFFLLYVTVQTWVSAIQDGNFGGVGISTCLLAMLLYACCRRRNGPHDGPSSAEAAAAWTAALDDAAVANSTARGRRLHQLQRGVTDLKRSEFSYYVFEADGSLRRLPGAAEGGRLSGDGSAAAAAAKSGGGGGGSGVLSAFAGRRRGSYNSNGQSQSQAGSAAATSDAQPHQPEQFVVALQCEGGDAQAADVCKAAAAAAAGGFAQTDCSICLSDYEARDQLCRLPCGHLFHTDCVFQWLDEHRSCPFCKRDLMGEPNAQNAENDALTINAAFHSFAAAAAAADAAVAAAAAAAAEDAAVAADATARPSAAAQANESDAPEELEAAFDSDAERPAAVVVAADPQSPRPPAAAQARAEAEGRANRSSVAPFG